MSEMKLRSLIKAIPVAIILLIFSHNVWSQVVVERSKDKVVISGVTYYIHQVKKGETAYSISKAYGITVEELTKENPPAVIWSKCGSDSEDSLQAGTGTSASQSEACRTTNMMKQNLFIIILNRERPYIFSQKAMMSLKTR